MSIGKKQLNTGAYRYCAYTSDDKTVRVSADSESEALDKLEHGLGLEIEHIALINKYTPAGYKGE
ncbi:hypothetical protein NVP1015O_34 [Vibrio phage 1.015.O._10N.222.51.E5]|nr:hypothetical protein NVP1015O_34 [Vibrio phage 1.015.O._10N.222.51.E5]AUR90202.1 hypothetical protein NVP1139A_34 [Vibrio phage 1.139.A._10N.261.48.C6]AUR90269.1 hypothetical protein NVP1139B_34 [Vibrio phage 1.139.B._10N.261.48.C6]AUR95590.1 hypothetical protein NVP1209O_33 [Vibrio phage 1.209.O._10N.222.52.B2]